MVRKNWMLRARILGTALLLVGVATACEDEIGPEPVTGFAAQVNAIRLAVGTQNVTLYKDGKVTLSPVSFVRPSVTINASLLDAQGAELTSDPAAVQVNMGTQTGTGLGGVTYTRTSAFSGTLAGTNAGILNLGVSLFDLVKRRTVFGPYNIPVVIR